MNPIEDQYKKLKNEIKLSFFTATLSPFAMALGAASLSTRGSVAGDIVSGVAFCLAAVLTHWSVRHYAKTKSEIAVMDVKHPELKEKNIQAASLPDLLFN